MFNRKGVPALCASLFFVVSVYGQSMPIPNTYTAAGALPPVGLAATETAQVNIANTAVASANGTPASCTGSIAFYDSSGTMIGKAASFAVGAKQIFSVTLPYASTGASGTRTVIRAEIVSMAVVAGFGIPSCALESSLEIYDTASGVTHAVISGVPAPSIVGVIRSGALTPAN